jgi:hypothetical protein
VQKIASLTSMVAGVAFSVSAIVVALDRLYGGCDLKKRRSRKIKISGERDCERKELEAQAGLYGWEKFVDCGENVG